MEIGKFNVLRVKKILRGGCVLEGGKQDIYLHKIDVPKETRVGDHLRVFVFNDGRDKLGATTGKPLAMVGDFASLKVRAVQDFGIFLDWGISKDLFVPKKYLRRNFKPGETAVVRLIHDYEGTGIIGTCKLAKYFEEDISKLEETQEVDILVYGSSDLGFTVIVDNKYNGLIYRNEVFEPLEIGDRRRGFVKKLREDGGIDIALQRQGFLEASSDAKDKIITLLSKDRKGFLPLHDKSSPGEIQEKLGMSKKIFKRSLGVLYKEGRIKIEDKGIRLLKKEKK